MTRQYAIDRAKLMFREDGRSCYVVRLSADEYGVMDRAELEKGLAERSFGRDAIIFSIEGEQTGGNAV